MLLNELLIRLGVDVKQQDLNKLQEAESLLNKLPIAASMVGSAFISAAGAITAFVDNQLSTLDEIHQLSKVTGETADQIYLLGKVAEVNGSSMEAAQSTIDGLSKVIGEAAAGVGRGAKAFEDYGLSAKNASGQIKTTGEMLGEISEKMQTMSKQEQIAMLSKLGIDGSMIQTLRLGNAELQAAIENANKLTLGVGNAENAKQAAAFKDAMTELSQIFKAMGEFVAIRVAPSIQRLIERFKAWFLENNDLVKAVLDGFGKIFSFLFELAAAVDNIVSSTLGWKTVIYAVGAAMLWLSRQMLKSFATNPIFLTIAAITALILLIDDFIVYLKGGETALGDFWEPLAKVFDWVMETINAFKPEIQAVIAYFLAQWERVKTMFSGLVTFITGLWAYLKGVFTGDSKATRAAIEQIWSGLKTFFTGLMAFLWNAFKAGLKVIGSILAGVFDLIAIPFELAWDWVKQKWQEFTDNFNVDPIGTIFGLVLDFITAPFELAFQTVLGLWQRLTGEEINLDQMTQIFDRAKEVIINAFKAAFDWIGKTWEKVTGWFSSFFDDEKEMNISANVKTVSDSVVQGANVVAGAAQLAPSSTAKSGLISNNNADNSVKNSNNKITINQTINGTGNTAQDAHKVADASSRAIGNQLSLVVG